MAPARTRRFEVSIPATLVFGAVGLFFCVTPGLDAPNYHGAFLLTLLAGVVGGLSGVFAGARAARDVLAPARLAARRILLPALVPLILLLLNGLRVRQCDVALGVAFHLVGPVFTALFAASVGAWLGAAIESRGRAVAAFALVWLVSIGLDILHILTEPVIFAFNPFGGFFSGNLYDTVIPLDGRYLSYRVANLALLALGAGLFSLGWDRRASRWSRATVRAATPLKFIAALLAASAVLAFWQARDTLGHQLDRGDIERALGGRLEDDRLALVYPAGVMSEAEARSLFEDHRYWLDRLETALGAPYARRITSYIYPDDATKKRLMGAGRVYLAKPWLDEIHLNRVGYGEPVVHHELAHVVLGAFAPSPLRIPTRLCVVPQMALVEGAAEAFEWDTGALTPHQWTLALREAGLAPPIARLLGPAGFYLQGSSLAYTMAGSFIRWLIDTRGRDAFLRLYADGDFDAAFDAPVDALVTEWEAFIAGQRVPPEAAAVASVRFRKRAIFFEVCGLDVARLEARAAEAAARGDIPAAREAYAQVVAWLPEDAEKRLPLVELASRQKDLAAARAASAAYFARPERLVLSDARVLEVLADTHLRRGESAAAALLYPVAASFPLEPDRLRTLAVKQAIALGGSLGDTTRARLADWLFRGDASVLDAAGADPLALYLAARRLHLRREHGPAAARLAEAERVLGAIPEPPQRLAWVRACLLETTRMLGISRYFLGELDLAEAAFARFTQATSWDGDRERYLDWLRRIEWRRKGGAPAPARVF